LIERILSPIEQIRRRCDCTAVNDVSGGGELGAIRHHELGIVILDPLDA
jgi:hypothetical protein